jgi:hypothetical protein
MAMTPLKTAAAGVAMFTLLMVFAIQRIPVPEPASASGARAGEWRFDAAWQDTVAVIPPMKKADQLRDRNSGAEIASTEPKVTERITPPAPDAPVSVPPVILVQDDDDKPPAARHRRHRNSEPGHSHSESNVCTKHKMKKVITHGSRSWRCRR